MMKAQNKNSPSPREGVRSAREIIQERVRGRLAKFEEMIMAIVDSRLNAYANSLDLDLDLERLGSRNHRDTFNLITSYVCAEFEESETAVRGSRREVRVTMPRHVAMYLCRELTDATLDTIGEHFFRDHGTVINACQKVKDRCAMYPVFKKQIDKMEAELRREFGMEEERSVGTPNPAERDEDACAPRKAA